MRTEIIYEDSHIIVCRKPAGIAVQSRESTRQDMVSELKNYLKTSYLGVVHRLDQPVEGVLVFAKTQAAAASLSSQVQSNRMGKIYHARVCGDVVPEEGELVNMLYKDGQTNLSRVVDEKFLKGPKGKMAKQARLSYRVLSKERVQTMQGEVVLTDLEVRLDTGRHHQIRVQLAHLGHPILGDTKYGTDESKAVASELGTGLCLKAATLSFTHPQTGKKVTFSA